MEEAPEVVRILGCHILRHLSATRPADNVLVSPFGVVAVVSLAMAGAQRSTEREMADVLLTKVPQFHKSMRRLLVLPPSPGSSPPEEEVRTFRMANRILLNNTMPLADSFRKIGERVYRTLVTPADFSQRAAQERRVVDIWVECMTGVKGALPASCPLNASTRMVLLSVVCLNTLWKHAFQKTAVERKPFGGSADGVATMCNTAIYGYACLQELALSAVDVPLMCEGFSVTILLPQTSLTDICGSITSAVLQQVFEAVQTTRRRVRLELPKFTAQFETELSGFLQDLGIREAFTDQANFRTVTTSTPVSISWVVHKLELCVHEGASPPAAGRGNDPKDVEAAPHELEFLVNKPFVICVRKLDILVLLGCVRRIEDLA